MSEVRRAPRVTDDPTRRWASAAEIAAAVRAGRVRAEAVAEAGLARIAAAGELAAYTEITADRALAEARARDRAVADGRDPGPLAGVPFAVKNLFDVEGLATRAGSAIGRDRAPARRDAALVRRLTAAGAVLTGALNMGEYAYDFTGENAHDGAVRNPHDALRMAGGSSSGSAAATAAGLVPLALGSDTNGSLRVPASLCGVFSLKPTYGRLSRAGTFPFVDSLDHLGGFARTVRDLALVHDAVQGPDAEDHACADRRAEPVTPALSAPVGDLRIGVPGGWFAEAEGEEAVARLTRAASALGRLVASVEPVDLPGAASGRAAAYLVTNIESAALHLPRLRTRAAEYDPDTRDRFLAGALLPGAWYVRAQAARRRWLAEAMAAFRRVDALIVPATPVTAPLIGQKTLRIGGREVALRPNLGLLAQPFSCIGLPVLTVPVFAPGELPLGIQIVGPPWAEARLVALAAALERSGAAVAHSPVRCP